MITPFFILIIAAAAMMWHDRGTTKRRNKPDTPVVYVDPYPRPFIRISHTTLWEILWAALAAIMSAVTVVALFTIMN